jgi:hypothetical protein
VGVILVELLAGTAALSRWLGSTSELLRGTARWDGKLPAPVESALGSRAAAVKQLASQLLAEEPARRPDAASTGRALRSILAP